MAALLFLASACPGTNLSIDACSFRGDSGQVYIELYISLPRYSISHIGREDGWYGKLDIKTTLHKNDALTAVDNWHIEDYTPDVKNINYIQHLVDVRIYQVNPGNYSIEVTAVDSASGSVWTANREMHIAEFARDSLVLSDVELASHTVYSGFQEKYDRGEFGLIPNPRLIFGGVNPFIIYYFEIYPPSVNRTGIRPGNGALPMPANIPERKNQFIIERSLIDSSGKLVQLLPQIIRSSDSFAFSEVDSISLLDLPTGDYKLQIEVSSTRGDKRRLQKGFSVVRLDTLKLEDELNEINFLLTGGQRKILQRMSNVEKAQFLEDFWGMRGKNRSSGGKSLRKAFRQRVSTADERWSAYNKPGHKTDRGRIYILYGEPDLIERFPLGADTNPHEIWTYDQLEGGSSFIYVDRSGLGNYELIHSTMRGEVSIPDWYEIYIERGGLKSRR